MKDQNKTKEQLITELVNLRQENDELKLALKGQDYASIIPELPSPSPWFSADRPDSFVSFSNESRQPISNSNKYHISELLDIPLLKQLFESYYASTGISHSLFDANNNVLIQVGWQDICTQFHRACPKTFCRCSQSESYIASHLYDGPYVGYQCLNGLVDYAVPIIIEGEHLATIYKGQFLYEPPDEKLFRCQAKEFGFDEEAYLDALRRVPIIPEKQAESIMSFFSQLGQFLATIGRERKRQLHSVDQALKEKEERLRQILEGSTDAFLHWSFETGFVYYSQRWAEILGYSQEEIELYIKTWKKLIHPDDIERAQKKFNEHLDGSLPKYETELRLLTKSGEWKWIRIQGKVAARNKQGKPLSMSGTCNDITDYKRAEMMLIQSEQKFSKAFRCNPDPITIMNTDGQYIEVNDAWTKTTGYERHEAIGHNAEELNIWTFAGQWDLMLEQMQKTGYLRNYEAEFRMKSGEIRNFFVSAEIIDMDEKKHILYVHKDLTERKQLDKALRLSDECFSKAFNASPVLMAIITVAEGKFIKANNAFCNTMGYSTEKIIGKSSVELGFWSNPVDGYLLKQSLWSNQCIKDMEIQFRKNTGEERWGLLSAERLDVHGEPCLLYIITDITKLRQMEGEINRLDRLNIVGEMAASIGHEIRNPMTTVRGYLQLLQTNTNYHQEVEYFNLMIEELDRANSIITEFLSLAKNKMLDMTPQDLNSIINKTLPLIQVKAISRDQIIRLELNDLPDLLLDEKEIRQLILNLVNNGIESMSIPGNIIIRTFIEKENVVLAVKDEGHGIDHELMSKLGTPFFTTKEQGTGLGLAVCYRIATRHNATIDIDTSPAGTTFYVKFPITRIDKEILNLKIAE